MKFEKILILFLVLLITPMVANSASLSYCSIKTSCDASETAIFRTSDVFNAHAELNSQSPAVFGYNVCCSGTDISTSPTSFNVQAPIRLFSSTNSHVSTDNSYTNPVYIGSALNNQFSCNIKNTNCNLNEACVVSVSDITNAHVSNCTGVGSYATKVCCSFGSSSVVPSSNQCILRDSYWYSGDGSTQYSPNYIEMNNTLVRLVANTAGCSDIANAINFSVWRRDCSQNGILLDNSTGIPSCTGGNFDLVESMPSPSGINNNFSYASWYTNYKAFNSSNEQEYIIVAKIIGSYNATFSPSLFVNKTNNPNYTPIICENGDCNAPKTCGDNILQSSSEVCDGNLSCSGANYYCYNCRACLSVGIGSLTTSTSTLCKTKTAGEKYGEYIVNTTTRYKNSSISSTITTKKCILAKEIVPFFDFTNLFVTIILLIVFYVFMIKKENKNK